MAMVAGQCTHDPVTGLAGRAFTSLQSTGASTLGMSAAAFTDGAPARNALAGLIEAIAAAVVAEIQAHAVPTISGNSGTIA